MLDIFLYAGEDLRGGLSHLACGLVMAVAINIRCYTG